jgi:hypothetical protein
MATLFGGAASRGRRAKASTVFARARCETATPLGRPVEPDVNSTYAGASRSICAIRRLSG